MCKNAAGEIDWQVYNALQEITGLAISNVYGYRTKKAMKFKVEFIKAFDFMREKLQQEGYSLMHKYNELCIEHKAKKTFASLCGKGLREWKSDKPVLEATLKLFEDKLQIELPIK